MIRRWWRQGLSLLILGAALWFLDWRKIAATFAQINIYATIAALLITVAVQGVLGIRWIVLINPVVRLPAATHLRMYFYGNFLNSVTPAALGMDIYRVAALRHYDGDLSKPILAVLRERVLGLMMFLAAGCGGVLLQAIIAETSIGTPLVIGAYVAGAALLAMPAGPILIRVFGTFGPLQRRAYLVKTLETLELALALHRFPRFGLLLGLSLCAWVMWYGAIWVFAADIGLEVPPFLLVSIIAFTEIIRLVPISFQGIGVRESAFAAFAVAAGGDPTLAFVVGAATYLVVSLSLLVCAPLSLAMKYAERRAAR
jgi:uncharacterized membrane protein YbhN (UPF0104 family)